jgi:hypothetical protein
MNNWNNLQYCNNYSLCILLFDNQGVTSNFLPLWSPSKLVTLPIIAFWWLLKWRISKYIIISMIHLTLSILRIRRLCLLPLMTLYYLYNHQWILLFLFPNLLCLEWCIILTIGLLRLQYYCSFGAILHNLMPY